MEFADYRYAHVCCWDSTSGEQGIACPDICRLSRRRNCGTSGQRANADGPLSHADGTPRLHDVAHSCHRFQAFWSVLGIPSDEEDAVRSEAATTPQKKQRLTATILRKLGSNSSPRSQQPDAGAGRRRNPSPTLTRDGTTSVSGRKHAHARGRCAKQESAQGPSRRVARAGIRRTCS